MRGSAAVVLLVALGSCQSATDDAEKQLAIVEQSGNPRQKCEAHRKLADAYLAQHNRKQYEQADTTAKIACRRAAQQGY
jgi:hypothetical protein